FKPFVYLAALEQNHPPTEQIEDAPLRVTLAGGQVWEPRNYTGTFDGPITLREALVRSKNIVTVRLAEEVGMRQVIRTARDLGIQTPIANVPATALGSAEVRPIELISAYAPLANGGTRVEPHLVRRVEGRNGETIWEAEPARERASNPAAAFVLTTILQDAVNRGTGTPVRTAGFTGPAAGKTGTTNGSTDVWFVGYTPELVGGIWIGLDRPATIVPGASGGTLAAPVWGRMMQRIYATRPMPEPWRAPAGVVTAQVERTTGLAVDAGCPIQGATYTEYFVNALPPQRPCYPEGQFPVLVDADRPWIDEEWGGDRVEIDTTSSTILPGGIDWPELEAIRGQRETLPAQAPLPRSRPGVTLPEPLPPPTARREGEPQRRREPEPESRPRRLLGVRADSATGTRLPAPVRTRRAPPDGEPTLWAGVAVRQPSRFHVQIGEIVLTLKFRASFVALATLLLPLGLAAQQRPVAQQRAAAPTPAQQQAQGWYMELQGIQMQLGPAIAQAMRDPKIQAAQQALGAAIQAALNKADPGLAALEPRMKALEAEAAKAQQAGDRAKLQKLMQDAAPIQQRLMRAQQVVFNQPAVMSRANAFESQLQAKLIQVDPKNGPLIQRSKQLQTQLQRVMQQQQAGRP
ncbi:MAG: penicillin-binding transpeptidase domain-containing protein, partial [Gemmatimonadota bacterium]|nr:penicillin-binding transpeptidase domain-containing protein [Gemmatimonadota bacterium]